MAGLFSRPGLPIAARATECRQLVRVAITRTDGTRLAHALAKYAAGQPQAT
jgi:hypothetical protein